MNNINSKLNLKKGFLRMHNLMLFGLIPFFLVSYYYIYRFEPVQEIKLKNGDILKVKPFVASNAEVINPQILNSTNSKELFKGLQNNSDSIFKWNNLIRWFSENNPNYNILYDQDTLIFLDIPIECHKKHGNIDLYVMPEGDLIVSGLYDLSKEEWEFNYLTGEIVSKLDTFIIQKKYSKISIGAALPIFPPKEKIIVTNKNERLQVEYFADHNGNKSAVLNLKPFRSMQSIGNWENEIPFFYNKIIPSKFFNFEKNRFEWSKYFNWFYWKIDDLGYYNTDNEIYFIEPPFLGILQNGFQTEKKYFTTPFFVIYGVFLIIVYLGIVRLLRWIISGFLENSESIIEKENDDLKQSD